MTTVTIRFMRDDVIVDEYVTYASAALRESLYVTHDVREPTDTEVNE